MDEEGSAVLPAEAAGRIDGESTEIIFDARPARVNLRHRIVAIIGPGIFVRRAPEPQKVREGRDCAVVIVSGLD